MVKVSKHYDLLIENDNDPLLDSCELQRYMDKWDGDFFIEQLCLTRFKSVLEIGCGTGRLLSKILGSFKDYTGIDISPKTIERARGYFRQQNVSFILGDFLEQNFDKRYDVIFSSLTFMHIKDKKSALKKVFSLLNKNGAFVLSIDKNQSPIIDTGYSKIEIFPDNPNDIACLLKEIGFEEICINEIEFAFVVKAKRN